MRCLRENTLPQTYLLFECVVPGFTSNQPICSIDNIFKLPVYKSGKYNQCIYLSIATILVN